MQLLNNLHLIRQIRQDEADDCLYEDWKKLASYLQSDLRRLAPSLRDWSRPWRDDGDDAVSVNIEPDASWWYGGRSAICYYFSIFRERASHEDYFVPNVGLWINQDWSNSQVARSRLEKLRPEGFVSTYLDGEADPEVVFWKNLPLDDFLKDDAFDLERFVGDIASAFESLGALRPIIDEFLLQHPPRRRPVPMLGKALILDVETWGPGKPEQDEIVEVGLILTAYDSETGELAGVLSQYQGLRDPGRGSTAKPGARITRAMVSGKKLDKQQIESMVSDADTIIAHSTQFDRPRFERLFPSSRPRRWLCSCNGLEWRNAGCEEANLEYLCERYGVTNRDPHRAMPDAEALLRVLAKKDGSISHFAKLLRPEPPPNVARRIPGRSAA